MRLIITGSSGQIGTNLALRCIERGHEVLGIDCRPNAWTGAFPSLLADLRTFFPTGRLSVPQMPWSRPDAVVHLAAHAKVHELVETPERAFENIAMTQRTLDLCRALDVPIVLASSREVYGDAQRARSSETDAQFDQTPSPYAASKIASEAMVHAYRRAYGMHYLIFRLSNVYGRYDDDLARMQRVIPLFVHRIEHGEPVTVFGSDKVIDFTYIDDCIDGLVTGVERLHAGRVQDETINLAYGRGHLLLEAVAHIGRALHRDPIIVVKPKRAGEVTRYVADLAKARALLDFSPKIALDEGIARAVAWHFESRSVQNFERRGQAALR